jgi:hypothetical protein
VLASNSQYAVHLFFLAKQGGCSAISYRWVEKKNIITGQVLNENQDRSQRNREKTPNREKKLPGLASSPKQTREENEEENKLGRALNSRLRPGDTPKINISLDQMLQLGFRHCFVIKDPAAPLLPEVPHRVDCFLHSISIGSVRPGVPPGFELPICAGRYWRCHAANPVL